MGALEMAITLNNTYTSEINMALELDFINTLNTACTFILLDIQE